jgi:hypothetical protein
MKSCSLPLIRGGLGRGLSKIFATSLLHIESNWACWQTLDPPQPPLKKGENRVKVPFLRGI